MVGIIILAAGASSRLGQAKQLLCFQGKTLLHRTIQAALDSHLGPVLVVLGANADTILDQGISPEIQQVHNPQWEEGMASSIRAGIASLQQQHPTTTGALLLLCDQPFVSPWLLQQMVQEKKERQKRIVACAYQDTLGAPVLFDRSLFASLLLLKGQEGAKKLLSLYPAETTSIAFPQGGIDIDTQADYAALMSQDNPS
ncbi:NTP transferase domain-containing protein [Rufibacter glacialis]|uniref:NTP transferase domain-containing protein n=1 Tax=Rufibacter glacialis TaxID=1259555 RepID=A0A5M8QIY1_9BACT|nr:nucleotidyltransferase family protein [Rufibacter glacialis]KAA6434322.1 nucleotidyltransferase family protein [Rufibacter glacialis]GGK68573.1 hypothetical protein GCM10011405_15810 [Rufibacter glacialis]